MHPTADGYDIEVTLRNVSAGPVAQAGRVREYQSCGGPQEGLSKHPGPTFSQRFRRFG